MPVIILSYTPSPRLSSLTSLLPSILTDIVKFPTSTTRLQNSSSIKVPLVNA